MCVNRQTLMDLTEILTQELAGGQCCLLPEAEVCWFLLAGQTQTVYGMKRLSDQKSWNLQVDPEKDLKVLFSHKHHMCINFFTVHYIYIYIYIGL